jgi:hypothetical protein
VEYVVKEWILERNNKGIRVKNQYIRAKARRMYTELHIDDNAGAAESDTGADDDMSTPTFRTPAGRRARFKRNCFVSRRQTSSRQISAEAPAICVEFIRHAQSLIDLLHIKEENIQNMDHVPRYFETEPSSTITTRGSLNVLLKNGESSHKRLTVYLLSAPPVIC